VFGSDAFVLAQLANCRTVDLGPGFDLSRVSRDLRPLAERLLAVGRRERQAIWDEYVAGRFSESWTVPAPGPELVPSAPSAAPLFEPRCPAARVSVAPRHDPAAPDCGVRMTCAVDLPPRDVEWLWSGRVPLGMITMFAGDPKLGKSLVTLAMAAALSRGLPLPQASLANRPASTLLMSAEDDPARTIVPRLLAAGADLRKIHIVESVVLADGSEALPSLRADIDAITAAALRLGDCRLIVIDPVPAYLKGVDDNRNAMLRGVLSPLKTLAEELGAAIVLVSHLTKAASANGKHRVLGSIGYVAACRANYLFVPDRNDRTGRRVLMVDNGGNVAPAAATLAYTIEDPGGGPRVVWSDEPVPITVEAALRPRPDVPRRKEEPELSQCEDWLRQTLAGGRVLAAELRRACEDVGFSWPALSRARSRIGAVTRREGFGPGSKCYWQLCNAPPDESASTIVLPPVP